MAPIQTPTKELDIAFLVFVERYVSDLLKWDILTLFARNPSFCAPGTSIAQRLGRSVYAVRPDLGDLVLLGILEQVQTDDGRASYRLTQEPYLRRMVLKFADPSAARPA